MNQPAAVARLPRRLHPGSWWVWALGLATAAARTTNPLLLLLIIAVAGVVVASRRNDSPWGRSFRFYLLLGAAIVVIRVLFRVLIGGALGVHTLFSLPQLPMPGWAAGIVIGGPVTLESILAAAYDGLRLAAIVICIGAANSLADPKRLLRIVPRALHDVGTAIVVAVSLVPQLMRAIARVRRARKLRGAPGRGLAAARATVVPVMEEALDRAVSLAAAMEARGYGRVKGEGAATRLPSRLMLGGLVGVALGLYGLLDSAAASPLVGLPALLIGCGLAVAGFVGAGRHIERSAYRPDPWSGAEWAVAAVGVLAATGTFVTAAIDPASLHPSLQPLIWPTLPVVSAVTVMIAATAGWTSPPTASTRIRSAEAVIASRRIADDPVR